MQPHSVRKDTDAVREKAATEEKDVVEDVTDLDLTRAKVTPNQKEKGKAEAKKANRDSDLVSLATKSSKIHAAIVAVIITLPEPATSVRMTKRTVRQNHRTSKQTSTLPLTRRP